MPYIKKTDSEKKRTIRKRPNNYPEIRMPYSHRDNYEKTGKYKKVLNPKPYKSKPLKIKKLRKIRSYNYRIPKKIHDIPDQINDDIDNILII